MRIVLGGDRDEVVSTSEITILADALGSSSSIRRLFFLLGRNICHEKLIYNVLYFSITIKFSLNYLSTTSHLSYMRLL